MKSLLVLFSLVTSLTAHAAIDRMATVEEKFSPLTSPSRLNAPGLALSGIYKFSRHTEVIPSAVLTAEGLEENIGGASIDVFKNEAVNVEFLNGGDVLLTLRLADEESGRVPEQMVISAEEFSALGLQFVEPGTVADLKQKYSGYSETQVSGRGQSRAKPRRHRMRMESSRRGSRSGYGRDRNGRISGGGGNCVSVVKSITGFRGTAGNGVGMASALARTGWKSVGTSNLRRGTVCSWSGGFHGKGHVGWFDGSCFQPTYGGNCGSPGRNYRMIKCVAQL